MPYAGPTLAATTMQPAAGGRPGHRRSFSATSALFSDEKGPGAFQSMGSLPRRNSSVRSTPHSGPIKPTRVFHINDDDDSSSSDEDASPSLKPTHDLHASHDNHDDDDGALPPLKLKHGLRLNTHSAVPTVHLGVPFPRSSPSPRTPSPTPSFDDVVPPADIVSSSPAPVETPAALDSPSLYNPSSPAYQKPPRPSYNRRSSSTIVLSNGKPLKSSLKSSSSPNVTISAALNLPEHHLSHQRSAHLRARSEPATPSMEIRSSSSGSSRTASPPGTGTSTPKSVHFPGTDIATVRIFNRTAKPSSLLGEETETETEGENQRPAPGYPFPRFNHRRPGIPAQFTQPSQEAQTKIEMDLGSHPIPSQFPTPAANVHLESIEFTGTGLTGSILVRNVTFEKHVFIRFTMDEWNTTSEVGAKYVTSLSKLPASLLPRTFGDLVSSSNGEEKSEEEEVGWDRFSFSIRLEDYMRGLETKVIWMVARFWAPSMGQEWWDNNGQRNYRVGFKKVTLPSVISRTVSAPASTIVQPSPAYRLPRVETHPPRSSPSPKPPTYSPPTPTTPTHHRDAIQSATEKRLAKFSFANYARPTAHVSSVVAQKDHDSSAVHHHREHDAHMHDGGVNAEKLTAALTSLPERKEEEVEVKEAVVQEERRVSKSTIPGKGITLYLPTSKSKTTPVVVPSIAATIAASTTLSASSVAPAAASTAAVSTLEFPSVTGGVPDSPVIALPPGLVRRTESNLSISTDDSEELSEPPSSNPFDPSSPTMASILALSPSSKQEGENIEHIEVAPMQTPGKTLAEMVMSPTSMDSESLYKAFVDRWCFAGHGAGSASELEV